MNYRYTPKVSSNFSSTNNRFGAIAAVDETQGDGDFVPFAAVNVMLAEKNMSVVK